jgi:hypothetical protein
MKKKFVLLSHVTLTESNETIDNAKGDFHLSEEIDMMTQSEEDIRDGALLGRETTAFVSVFNRLESHNKMKIMISYNSKDLFSEDGHV